MVMLKSSRFIVLLSFFSILFSPFISAQQVRQAKWQQKVDYFIDVRLDDSNHTLTGQERLVYFNNSPNTLNEIYFHLWPNAYKSNNTAFAKQQLEDRKTSFQYAPDSLRGFITNLSFEADGKKVQVEYLEANQEIAKIILEKPLKTNETVTLTTPFFVKLPGSFSRMGYENGGYQISQWYPKPAVYDVNGWNTMPYLDQGEFYSEFGTFEVSITVPKNFIVMATGLLQNQEEIAWLKNRAETGITKSDEFNEGEEKTLKYIQKNVHDFAWFADKKWVLQKGKVVFPSGKEIETWCADLNIEGATKGLKHIEEAIKFYSEHVGEYPYDICQAVRGALKAGGGMEYPTITVVNSMDRTTVIHEVGHNWFYAIIGSNERKYPWMDEGLNSFYENIASQKGNEVQISGNAGKIVNKILGSDITLTDAEITKMGNRIFERRGMNQASTLNSEVYTTINYGIDVYGMVPVWMKYLREYLGTETFDECVQFYYETWKFKHPLPGDFKDCFEKKTEENLDWFFDGLLSDERLPDYKIAKATKTGNDYLIKIRNMRYKPAPIPIGLYSEGKKISQFWIPAVKKDTVLRIAAEGIDKIELNPNQYLPERFFFNNQAYLNKTFKTSDRLSFRLLVGAEHNDKKEILWAPVVAWNNYNKWMAGVCLYNSLLFRRNFEYILMPMYSLSENNINGYAAISQSFYLRRSSISKIETGINVSAFDFSKYSYAFSYKKIMPYVNAELANKSKRKSLQRNILIQFHQIYENKKKEVTNLPPNYKNSYQSSILDAAFRYENSRKIDPFNFQIGIEQNFNSENNFLKVSINGRYELSYEKPKKKLEIDFFGGKFITSASSLNDIYYLRLSGVSGLFDYKFNQALMGRSDYSGFFARQMINTQGNINSLITIGGSNNFVLSVRQWIYQ